MTARVQKHGEIGCEVRKKGPSKTTPKHSLNLCNGYAAGKPGKFTVQKKISILHAATSKAQKTGKRVLREPVGTGRRVGRAGVGAGGLPRDARSSPGVAEIGRVSSKMRDDG